MAEKSKIKTCDRPTAKRSGSYISAYVPAHLKKYLSYRANAEKNKNLTKVLIAIITKEMNNDEFYTK